MTSIETQADSQNASAVPDVSVILPIYNAEPYLREALDSILAQTFKNIEIICVNDGSTDSSPEILAEYSCADSRIIIDDGPNGGYGKAMNRGLDRARGRYIAILEPDDIILPTMYEKLVPIADRDNLDFVRADFNRFVEGEDGELKFWKVSICPGREHLYRKVLNPQTNTDLLNVRMQNWTGLTRRSFVEDHAIRFHETPGARFQDNSFWFQTYCWATRVEYVDEPFYCHRDDNPNSSTNRTDLTFAMLDEWKWLREYLSKHPEKEKAIIHVFQLRKFHNCNFAFSKLADELQLPFMERYSKELGESMSRGEIDEGLFDKAELMTLHHIISDPAGYIEEYRDLKMRGIDLATARKTGRRALFKYYVHYEGVVGALVHSARHIARAIARRLSK